VFGDAVRGRTTAIAVALLFVTACSDSPGPDTAPPAAVTDLAVASGTDSSLTVTWTAPGDDGSRGQAASYDLRYSLSPLPAGWDTALAVTGLAPPRRAGLPETVTVAQLESHQVYRLALKTLDDAGNVSGLSNIVEAETGDLTPPGRIVDLRTENPAPHAVTLVFTATGDNGNVGQAAAYLVRHAATTITEATWDAATPFEVTQAPQPAGAAESIRVTELNPGEVLHFAVRAEDDAGLLGLVSNDAVATLPADAVPPAAITDLAVTSTSPFAATLTWTAPGDDGDEGRAASYLVRYADAAITEATWGQATTVGVLLTPRPSGEAEQMVLTDLPGDRILWFAVRAVDAAGNQGAVSNSPSGHIRREPRTWEIRVDGSGDAPAIQAGIDSASDGDIVLVHPGTYYEHVDFHGENVQLRSADGPEATILDGSQEPGSVVAFRSGETREATIEGFTITGGSGTFLADLALTVGGGIYCQDSSPTIIGNTIRDNVAGFPGRGTGGGLDIDGSRGFRPLVSPLVEGNVFDGNRVATNGGGMTIADANVTISGNIFHQNECRYDGGAIYLAMSEPGTAQFNDNEFWENVAGDHGGAIEAGQQGLQSQPLLIQGNLFVRNEAHGEDLPSDSGTGGAISMRGWSGTISSNTFVDNVGTGGAPCTGGALLLASGTLSVYVERNIFASSQGCAVACRGDASGTQLTGNIFWANDPANVGNATGCFPYSASANLFADPLFCDPARDDYHVRSDSPALSDTLVIGAYDTPGCGP
jgi:hypothetical protein